MARILSQAGIITGQPVEAHHVSQSVEALTATAAYNISISGSLTMVGAASTASFTYAEGNLISGSFTGDGSRLTGITAETASYVSGSNVDGKVDSAILADTASRAIDATNADTATMAITAQTATSASYAATASILLGSIESASFALTSSHALTASLLLGSIESASFALTASHALNATAESASYALTSSHALVAVTSSHALTASLLLGSIESSSFAATASYAVTASHVLGFIESASYAATASYAISSSHEVTHEVSSSFATTSSFALTASHALNATAESASYATTASYSHTASVLIGSVESASYATTSSFALTASHALNANAESASYATTASYSHTASVLIGSVESASFATTSSFALTASHALNATAESASFATTASYAQTASYVENAQTASFVESASFATTSSHAITASYIKNAETASFVESSSFALSSSLAQTASFVESASYALTASHVPLLDTVRQDFASATVVNVNHSLNNENVLVQVYQETGSNHRLITPSEILVTSPNDVRIELVGATTGYVVVGESGYVTSGSIQNAVSASHIDLLETVRQDFGGASSITVNHNLNSQNVLIQTFVQQGSEHRLVIPDQVRIIDTNTAIVELASISTGYIVAGQSGFIASGSTQNAVTASFVDNVYRETLTGDGGYTVTHNLNEDWVVVQAYDSVNRRVIIPDIIESINSNTTRIQFASTSSVVAVIKK